MVGKRDRRRLRLQARSSFVRKTVPLAESNEEAMVAHSPTEIMDIDEDYSNLSKEELSLKMKMFTKLCSKNKINTSNAFDVDIFGCLKSWLKKIKTEESGNFTDIANYLEAIQKIYSCRVDNCSESTSKLVEEFRGINYKRKMSNMNNENEGIKIKKPKRSKLMLTTSDKLRRKPTEEVVIPNLKVHGFTNINYEKIIEDGHPSRYMKSFYSGSTLRNELNEMLSNNDKEGIQNNAKFIELPDIDIDFKNAAICHEFKNSVFKPVKNNLEKDNSLDGIEHRFDIDTYKDTFHPDPNLMSETNDTLILDEFQDNIGSNDQTKSSLNGLIECIDDVNRDYSFFNPQRLANWKGPKEWKAQAMVKALKSCNPNEQKKILSGSDISDKVKEIITKKTKQSKSNRKDYKGDSKKVKIEWLNMTQIDKKLKNCIKGNEQLLPSTVKKWNPYNYIFDPKFGVIDVAYKFTGMQYLEIKPAWWKKEQNPTTFCPKEERNTLETSSSNQFDYDENVAEIINDNDIMSMDIDKLETVEEMNVSVKIISGIDENICKEIKPESKIDIGVLKKEILMIINQECVQIDGESAWSRRLPFLKLLTELRVTEREGLTVAICYVVLLHLVNELNLKLFEEHCPQYNFKDIFITKPINRE